MTKQEAIEYGTRWKKAIIDRGDTENSEAIQFLNMVLEALEQNTVSEETYTHEYNLRKKFEWEAYILERKRTEQEPKSGRWIDRGSCQVDEDAYDVADCSVCNKEITIDPRYDNYCPNCGADMRGGTE